MFRYVMKRIGLMLITFIILVIIMFVLMKMLPDAYEPPFGTDPNQWEAVRVREGYDKPILVQFGMWIRNIFSPELDIHGAQLGRWGYSFYENRDVGKVLATRIPETVKINLVPFLISIPLGITLGIVAALKKNKPTDHIISFFVVLFISVPSFVIAVLLQYLFVYKWQILDHAFVLPASQAAGNLWGSISSRILPTIVLSTGTVAGWTRTLRAELTEVITSEFMLLAKSKGLSTRQVTIRHAVRNAFVPFAPSIIGGFVALMGGSLVIEQVFRVPGIGGVYLRAFGNRDIPLIMVVMMFYTFIGLLTSIVGDISYGFIDPRIKMGAGKSE